MTGAELLVKTATAAGIDICFSNPGTTEIPIVTALDSVPGIRAILGLFEGVCTGAADGYGRMKDKPAMVLLHLGPGLANGIANLHNARRAKTPVLNMIGEHAAWHRDTDPLLAMDIESLAKTVSGWQRTNKSSSALSQDTIEAITAAQKGQVSTLIIPHDHQWAQCNDTGFTQPQLSNYSIDQDSIDTAVKLLRSNQRSAIILGGKALRKRGLLAAANIKSATGCDLIAETFPAHMERGSGLPAVDRISYLPVQALAELSQYQVLIFAGAREPVAFFGYENKISKLLNEKQQRCYIVKGNQDEQEALECLADALGLKGRVDNISNSYADIYRPVLPKGELTGEKVCVTLAALQPENAIVVDEAITTGLAYYPLTSSVPPYSLLTLTGGAIGQGMPCAVGAAIACPDRPVINFQADGSAMYTLQSLWTQAREGLNITTLICSNRSYEILKFELARAGNISPGRNALSLIDIEHPKINWVKISQGLGVPAVLVDTAEKLTMELRNALKEAGPHLIEMIL